MRPTILIVDDSRAMRRIERNVVSHLGEVDVVEAEDGVSALYQLRDRKFQVDLILLDWMMPRMNGLSLAKRLKANANLSSIPILMVTSVSDERKMREAWRTGVDGYLLKPFTREMLLQGIASLEPGSLKPKEGHQSAAAAPSEGAATRSKPFMEELSHAARSQVLDIAEVVDVDDRVPILFRGEPAQHVLFLIEGEVEEHRPAIDQNGAHIRTYGPGECLAVAELMSGDALESNFVTSRRSKMARLQKPDFETLLLNCPEINMALSRHLAGRARDSEREGTNAPMSGLLDVLEVPDLIQAFNLRQVTGVIEFPDVKSWIELYTGQVVAVHHPSVPPENGREAFFRIVAQKPRMFRFAPKSVAEIYNVRITTAKLLLEYVQWLDERETTVEAGQIVVEEKEEPVPG